MNVARLLRLGSMLFVGAILATCLLGGAAVIYASPGGDLYRLAGIALGSGGDYTRVPRRSLDCARQVPNVPRESCHLTVDGAALTIEVEYYPPRTQWGFRECRASYGEKAISCRAGNFTVPGPPYAMIPGTTLDLPEGAVQALRRQHPLENLWEADWVRATKVMAYLLAAGAALVAFQAVESRLPLRAVAAAASGVVAFVLANFGLLLFLLFTGVVD